MLQREAARSFGEHDVFPKNHDITLECRPGVWCVTRLLCAVSNIDRLAGGNAGKQTFFALKKNPFLNRF